MHQAQAQEIAQTGPGMIIYNWVNTAGNMGLTCRLKKGAVMKKGITKLLLNLFVILNNDYVLISKEWYDKYHNAYVLAQLRAGQGKDMEILEDNQ